jgi:hypothetical protein
MEGADRSESAPSTRPIPSSEYRENPTELESTSPQSHDQLLGGQRANHHQGKLHTHGPAARLGRRFDQTIKPGHITGIVGADFAAHFGDDARGVERGELEGGGVLNQAFAADEG